MAPRRIHNLKQIPHKGLVLFENAPVYHFHLPHHLSLLALDEQVKPDNLRYHGLSLMGKHSLNDLGIVVESGPLDH